MNPTIETLARDNPHPSTGLEHLWRVHHEGGTLEWDGFCTGPLTLERGALDGICEQLLGHGLEQLATESARGLRSCDDVGQRQPRIYLHSSTPELNEVEGDLDAVRNARRALDFTTYKEARSPYLARPGDLAVGRTRPWRETCALHEVEALEVPDVGHYYLSHALLSLAVRHPRSPVPALDTLISRMAASPRTVVSLYAFEPEIQVFLLWLRAAAGLEVLYTDANAPAVAEAWNRKDVLHPSVALALTLEGPAGADEAWLALESARAPLQARLGPTAPLFPGYTIPRSGVELDVFCAQIRDAARLLRERHGLERACLKPSEAGDGARITPGIALDDGATLERLSKRAWSNGDAYLLEAHVDYLGVEVGGECVRLTPSAHVRGGRLAPGLTLQFMRGTSWKGNIYVDEQTSAALGLERSRYDEARGAAQRLVTAFEAEGQGLVTGGFDFGFGRLGGSIWGERVLIGVQDLNISFTGAECLRAYMDRTEHEPNALPCAASRVVLPAPGTDPNTLARAVAELASPAAMAQVVTAVPGRWGMIAMRGPDPRAAAAALLDCERALVERELLSPTSSG